MKKPTKKNPTIEKIIQLYPVYLQGKNYKKLLVIQTKPETKYWFKDAEITIEKLIHILEKQHLEQSWLKRIWNNL